MIYKGIFWLIEGELYTKKLECDKLGNVIGDGSGLNSKSGDNFNHRLTWEGLPKNVTHGKEYNYYPRGRVEIKGGKAVIYLNPALNSEEMLAELTRLFGLDELDFVRVKNDGRQGTTERMLHSACALFYLIDIVIEKSHVAHSTI